MCEQCWPATCEDDIKKFWHHLALHQSPLAEISPNKDHIPLWIWGDEAQYRENGDQVMLMCLGNILDKRKFSIEACYPLSLRRSDAWDWFWVCLIKSLLSFFLQIGMNSKYCCQPDLNIDMPNQIYIYICMIIHGFFTPIWPMWETRPRHPHEKDHQKKHT